MSVFDQFKQQVQAAAKKPRLVFPEGTDSRILEAVKHLTQERLVRPILLGKQVEVQAQAKKVGLPLMGVNIIDPLAYPHFEKMCQQFVALRHGKNTMEQVRKWLRTGSYFGTMLVKLGQADGMVSGAIHSTANTVRPALQIIKTEKGMNRVSGIMILERGQEHYVFADVAMNIAPDSKTLAEIGYQAAKVAKMISLKAKVAFLSFSTKGSAKGKMVETVREGAAIFKQNHPNTPADGELQFDAAFVPSVGKRKAPTSAVAGHANVFIFPELQSANIGYKIAQRLGGFKAVGPILAGLAAPVNDLSRGCSSDDVYLMGIITAAQTLVEGK